LNDLKDYIRDVEVSQAKIRKTQRLCKEAVNAISHKKMNEKFIKLESTPNEANLDQIVHGIFMREEKFLNEIKGRINETSLIKNKHHNENSHKDDKQHPHKGKHEIHGNEQYLPTIQLLDDNIQIRYTDYFFD